MLGALLLFFSAVAIGALLSCVLPPPPRVKDIYVQGRKVDLVALERIPRANYPLAVEIRLPLVPKWLATRLVVRRREDGTREVVEEVDPETIMQLYVTTLLDGLLLRGITR